MVERYINQRRLSKLGYTFPSSNLTDFDVSCFMIIGPKLEELEQEKLERERILQQKKSQGR